MLHLAVLSSAVGAAAVDAQVSAVVDGLLLVQGGDIVLPTEARLLMAYVQGATLTRARLSAPDFRKLWFPQIRPITVGALPGSDPNIMDLIDNPWTLPANNPTRLLTTNTGAGETHDAALLFDLPPYITPQPRREARWLRGTGTTALGVRTWTSVVITLDEALPPGKWDLIGLHAMSANALFARIFRPGSPNFRAGVVAAQTVGQRPHFKFSDGELGVILAGIDNIQQFTVEFFATVADAAETCWFQFARAA